MSSDMITYKVLVLGDSSVGKTAFIVRFCEEKFDSDNLSTIGVDIKTKFITRREKKINLQIWDTAGQERFRSIAKNSYKGADGIILMYDITNLGTFKHIKNWITDIKSKTDKPLDKLALIIVGNKSDLEDKREVRQKNIDELKSEHGLNIMETSAKDNKNINECIIELIDRMIDLGVGKIKKDGDDEDAQKLEVQKTEKKKDCCQGGGKKKK